MLLIKNGKVMTMAGKTYTQGYVLAQDGKIISAGDYFDKIEQDALRDSKGNLMLIDAAGGYILPGFIDAHCHVGMLEDSVGFEGDDVNEMTDPITPHLRAIDGAYHADRAFAEARESGITTVVTGPGSANVIGGQFAALKTFGRSVDEMLLKSPVAMKIAFGENPKTAYNEKKQMPMTRMATAALLRESLMKTLEYKKRLDNHNEDSENNGIPDFDIKLEALLPVITGELPLKAHAHRADDILTAIRLAKEFDLKLSIDHCTEGHLIADILAEEGVAAICGPFMSDRSKIELRNQEASSVGILSKAGVKVAIMTDHPATPVKYLTLCAAIAVKEGMDEEEAIKAITINAAEITGISDRTGSLETGKDADIVILSGHPLELKSRVMYTVIDGKIVFRSSND